jgi:hypothetical protein
MAGSHPLHKSRHRAILSRKEKPGHGAHLFYRYENGKLTDKPLWPWPMNDRIKVLIDLDVTATVMGLGALEKGENGEKGKTASRRNSD